MESIIVRPENKSAHQVMLRFSDAEFSKIQNVIKGIPGVKVGPFLHQSIMAVLDKNLITIAREKNYWEEKHHAES